MVRRLIYNDSKILLKNKRMYILWLILFVFAGLYIFTSSCSVEYSVKLVLEILQLDLFLWLIICNAVLASNNYLFTTNYYEVLRVKKYDLFTSRFVLCIVSSFVYITLLFGFIFSCFLIKYHWSSIDYVLPDEEMKLIYLYVRYILITIFVQIVSFYFVTLLPQMKKNILYIISFIMLVFLISPNEILINMAYNPILQLNFTARIIISINDKTNIVSTIFLGHAHIVTYIVFLIFIYLKYVVKKVEIYET